MRQAAFIQERPPEDSEFFERLDETVKKAGVRDASSALVPGFPYLRTNRFLACLGKTAKNGQEQEQWAYLMRQLDLTARKKEIRNLPDEDIVALGYTKDSTANREELYSRLQSASQQLLDHDRARADFYTMLSRP